MRRYPEPVVYFDLANGKGRAVADLEGSDQLDYLWYLSTHGYAVTGIKVNGKPYTLGMHRLVLGLQPYDGLEVDHINGNKLDNRRANLRIVPHSVNVRNNPPNRRNASGYKGVAFHKATGRYRATIKANGRTHHLGVFDDPAEAARAYDEAARAIDGPLAWTNGGILSI